MNSADALTLNAWLEKGGFAEAVVRMAIAGGAESLAPEAGIWNDDPRLASVPSEERGALVAEQASIVRFSRGEAIDTLGVLVQDGEDRARALALALRTASEKGDFDASVQARIRRVLKLPRFRSRRSAPARSMPTSNAQSWGATFPPVAMGH